jgi:hypothetical protein
MCAAHNLMNGTNVSVNEIIKATQFKLFPNPAKQHVNFSITQKPELVTLIDVLGRDIDFSITEKQSNIFELEFKSDMVNGIYFLSIKTSEGFINSKFIKE